MQCLGCKDEMCIAGGLIVKARRREMMGFIFIILKERKALLQHTG